MYMDQFLNMPNRKQSDCSIQIGKRTMFQVTAQLNVYGNTQIMIGWDCLFARGVNFYTSDAHAIYDIDSKMILNPDQSIVIEDHVWSEMNIWF